MNKSAAAPKSAKKSARAPGRWVQCVNGYARDGWKLRKITAVVDGGAPMFWLYRPDHKRYTPTGLHNDSVSWRGLAAAKRGADEIIAKEAVSRQLVEALESTVDALRVARDTGETDFPKSIAFGERVLAAAAKRMPLVSTAAAEINRQLVTALVASDEALYRLNGSDDLPGWLSGVTVNNRAALDAAAKLAPCPAVVDEAGVNQQLADALEACLDSQEENGHIGVQTVEESREVLAAAAKLMPSDAATAAGTVNGQMLALLERIADLDGLPALMCDEVRSTLDAAAKLKPPAPVPGPDMTQQLAEQLRSAMKFIDVLQRKSHPDFANAYGIAKGYERDAAARVLKAAEQVLP